MNKKILINATNLHNGGAIQVASSFLNELVNIDTSHLDISIWASTKVIQNVPPEILQRYNVTVIDIYGIKNFFKNRHMFNNFDIVFTIFGPNYLPIKGINIVGFAQPWIIYPQNDAYFKLSFINSIKYRIAFYIKKQFFKKANHFIVELEHVKKEILTQRIAKSDKDIDVVYNCISNIYKDKNKWEYIDKISSNYYKIGFISRDYSHKNIDFLVKVKNSLQKDFNCNVDFFVTLTESEWSKKPEEFRNNINNIGELAINQCPNFYENMDAIIFPSLLECFSATPLEAMAMGKPLFASDRPFVKDICGDYAYYFDPLNATLTAKIIHNYISNISHTNEELTRLGKAQKYAYNFSSAEQRAIKYVKIIEKFLDK